jgi:hypothetical protein
MLSAYKTHANIRREMEVNEREGAQRERERGRKREGERENVLFRTRS